MNKFYKKSIFIFTITGLLLMFFISGLFLYCKIEKNKEHSFTFIAQKNPVAQDGILVDSSISKRWEDVNLYPQKPCGAQYDFVITNDSKWDFYNWEIEFTFPNDLAEDSSWNGNYVFDKNTFSFTPNEDICTVKPSSQAKFGAVLYSLHYGTPKTCTLTGYFNVRPKDFFLYKLLLLLSGIWLLTLIVYICTVIKTRQYIKYVEHDAQIIEQTMKTITGFIDAKDPYTRGHSVRVACYAQEIARRMKLSDNEIRNLYYITLLHDCGKIGIPDSILKKPSKLTYDEFEIIKQHTIIGDQTLDNFTAIPGIREGAHYHHEHYDGKGYPDGLKGKDIPLFARIICIADSYDAMSSNRCYRKALTKEKIISEIENNSGKQFDPDIIPYMLDMINDDFVETIKEKYPVTQE